MEGKRVKDNSLRFLWHYVDMWAEKDPGLTALRDSRGSCSWGELKKRTENLARAFISMGIGKGDTIATMLPTSMEYIFTLIAADRIGAIICALDVKYKTSDLRRFISHIEPAMIIAVEMSDDFDVAGALEKVDSELGHNTGIHYVFTGDNPRGTGFNSLLNGSYETDRELNISQENQDLDDGMLTVFTGGTTGIPKAALLTKQNVARMAKLEADVLGRYTPGRIKALACMPTSHVGGTVEMIAAPITHGYELILHENWSPERVLETTEKERLTYIGGVPTMYAITMLLPGLDKYDLSSLKVAILSGEKVEMDLLNMISEKICPAIVIGYGSTEAGSEIAFTEVGDDFRDLVDGYVGKPLPGVEVRIVDDEGRDLSAGEKGEILVRGPLTIKNYFRMPEEDRAGFAGNGWCLTGDLGYQDDNGGLWIKGRKKHIIRVGSYTVMPSEVEDVILRTGTAGMAAVIGVPDSVYGEVVWAVVQAMPGTLADEEKIIEKCKEELAGFKVPRRVIFRDSLPVTRIGKVHRVQIQNEIIESIKNS